MRSAGDVFPSVLLGLCLSTAALHFIPHLAGVYLALKASEAGGITTASGAGAGGAAGELLARLLVLGASTPLQLCEHSTVAYAAAIQKAGGAQGLSFAFLLVTPATNLPSLLLLLRAQERGRRTAARVACSLVGTALALSYAVDALALDMLVEKEADEGGELSGMAQLPALFVAASWWLGGALALAAAAKALGLVAFAAEEKAAGARAHAGGKCCDDGMKAKAKAD